MENSVQLSTAQQQKILEAIAVGEDMMRQMDLLEQCGESCQLRRVKLQTTTDRLRKMLQNFGPK